MKRNQKKLRKLQQYGNVIMFPGTYEKLVRNGERYLHEQQYEKAVEVFDQAIQLEPKTNHISYPFALALYETKDFRRAKEFALQALKADSEDYMPVMELYLTVLIQLEEHEEVELSIEALIEEGFIPPNLLNKFIYLRDLNRRLTIRYDDKKTDKEKPSMTFEDFQKKDLFFQHQFLTSLKGQHLKRSVGLLEEIINSGVISASISTFSLMLLKEVGYNQFITIQKYGQKIKVNPTDMALPGQDLHSQAVLSKTKRMLEKDPSQLQFVEDAIRKFTINAFPLTWGDYSAETVANAYVQYIEHLMTGKELAANPLLAFIQTVDQETDF